MAEPDQAGVVIHGLRNEFTVDVSVNGLRRLSGSFAIDLARVSRAAGQSGGCGGGYGNVVVSSNLPGPIPARDRDGAGLETVEEMLDQGGTSYVDRAIARGGERCSLGCRARRVTDPATGAGHEGVPGVERRHNGHASTRAHQ